jgi:hypothetical protein
LRAGKFNSGRDIPQRREDPNAPWDGEEALWMVAPHVPAILAGRRTLDRVAPGCYRVEPSPFPFLWIAANELPLADEARVDACSDLETLRRWHDQAVVAASASDALR